MLFMLRMDASLPAAMPLAQVDILRQQEKARGEQLIEQKMLVRIWRVVGRLSNVSIWNAPSLEVLHEAVTSLPMSPYMTVEVTPLIDHPVTHLADSMASQRPVSP
ncbi:MAG: muconolactone delta-isomerase [Alcaligenaceae bacterium]|nr:MAG: muconolactone delta-isomerase [Alcaligenaceae bacterium]